MQLPVAVDPFTPPVQVVSVSPLARRMIDMSRFSVFLRATIPALVLSAALAGCAQSPSRGSYVVFFDSDSVSLTPAALAVVRDAAAQARILPAKHVIVAGSAGLHGDPDILRQLAASRAAVVAAQLKEDGVGGADITQISQAPTDIADSRVALRRVSITLGEN